MCLWASGYFTFWEVLFLPLQAFSLKQPQKIFFLSLLEILNLCDHLYRGAARPTLKTAEKQPKRVPSGSRSNSRKNSRNTRQTAVLEWFSGVSAVFRLFFGCLTGTLSAPSSAVFRPSSVSGMWHLCIDSRRDWSNARNSAKATTRAGPCA